MNVILISCSKSVRVTVPGGKDYVGATFTWRYGQHGTLDAIGHTRRNKQWRASYVAGCALRLLVDELKNWTWR